MISSFFLSFFTVLLMFIYDSLNHNRMPSMTTTTLSQWVITHIRKSKPAKKYYKRQISAKCGMSWESEGKQLPNEMQRLEK